MPKRTDITPSARRLINSMRDLGYDFTDAVAEIVDNSIQANASVIQVSLNFDGEDSYLTVMDNGEGMSDSQLIEAMRYGSIRNYEEDDLGKFGLGLKTASLSQCDLLTVSTRSSSKDVKIHSYSWDIDHITSVDKWEILPVDEDNLLNPVVEHLYSTVGTVVTWEKLNRLLNFQNPSGWRAAGNFERLVQELKLSIATTFHRYLTGEQQARRIIVFVNNEMVEAWDPFARSEPNTKKLDEFSIRVGSEGNQQEVLFKPFVLPHQSEFSSHAAHIKAGGIAKWNKQQGFYIYRAGRLLQSGGWCGLRTSDEHSKLARIMVDIPPGFDHIFKVNVAKMKINFPREIRQDVISQLSPVLKLANEAYRHHGDLDQDLLVARENDIEIGSIEPLFSVIDSKWKLKSGTLMKVLPKLYATATSFERKTLLRLIKKAAL